MKSGVKQMQLSHSNAWLTMVKSHNSSLYERVAKLLETWEREEQDKACYQKLGELLRN
jgi:hypothetical protein